MGFHSSSATASSEIGSFRKEAGLLGRESDRVDDEGKDSGGDEAGEEDNRRHPFSSSKGL